MRNGGQKLVFGAAGRFCFFTCGLLASHQLFALLIRLLTLGDVANGALNDLPPRFVIKVADEFQFQAFTCFSLTRQIVVTKKALLVQFTERAFRRRLVFKEPYLTKLLLEKLLARVPQQCGDERIGVGNSVAAGINE